MENVNKRIESPPFTKTKKMKIFWLPLAPYKSWNPRKKIKTKNKHSPSKKDWKFENPSRRRKKSEFRYEPFSNATPSKNRNPPGTNNAKIILPSEKKLYSKIPLTGTKKNDTNISLPKTPPRKFETPRNKLCQKYISPPLVKARLY